MSMALLERARTRLLLGVRNAQSAYQRLLPGLRKEAEAVTAWMPRDLIIAPVSDKEHEAVRIAQRALRLEPTGEMDEATKASLRGLQRFFNLPVNGHLDRATAERVDRLRPAILGAP